MQRPDLSQTDPEIRAYIEYLETQLRINESKKTRSAAAETTPPERDDTPLPAEPPTTIGILTASPEGVAKRTYRHLYTPQHRGGMGVFDLDVPEPDYPSILSSSEEGQNILLFTTHARVFRYPLGKLPGSPVRSKGQPLFDILALEGGEKLAAILPERAQGYVALVSTSGRVRSLRHHLFGEHMRPGTAMYPYREFGPLASVCWTAGDAELFLVTEKGMGIRFAQKAISPQGDQGIRLADGDQVAAVTEVYADSGVFIVGADGKGCIRQMSGFAPNKSAGGMGKLAIKSEHVAGATVVEENDDLFILTRLGKMIRFRADEVPPTEGVVQGVNCVYMRGDEVLAVTRSGFGRP